MKRNLRIERTYPHPRELVWEALTTRELLAQWLMDNDFVPVRGHRFLMHTDPAPGFDGTVHCEVLELEAPRRMTWSWKGGPIDTRVTFTLEDAVLFSRPGTRLRVEHTGFDGLPAVLVSFILGAGNRGIYGRRLPAVLARLAAGHHGGDATAAACEKNRRGLWWWLARAFAPILRRAAR